MLLNESLSPRYDFDWGSPMKTAEEKRLEDLERRLTLAQRRYRQLSRKFNEASYTVKKAESEVNTLLLEREALQQGQLMFPDMTLAISAKKRVS